jgi:hypothetical protein
VDEKGGKGSKGEEEEVEGTPGKKKRSPQRYLSGKRGIYILPPLFLFLL